MHLLSQIIYSCKSLYMFQKVFPSIIRSSKLSIQQRYMSNSCCYLQVAAAIWNIPLLYTQFWSPDDGRKDRPKHVEPFTREIIWDNRCILFVVLQEYNIVYGKQKEIRTFGKPRRRRENDIKVDIWNMIEMWSSESSDSEYGAVTALLNMSQNLRFP